MAPHATVVAAASALRQHIAASTLAISTLDGMIAQGRWSDDGGSPGESGLPCDDEGWTSFTTDRMQEHAQQLAFWEALHLQQRHARFSAFKPPAGAVRLPGMGGIGGGDVRQSKETRELESALRRVSSKGPAGFLDAAVRAAVADASGLTVEAPMAILHAVPPPPAVAGVGEPPEPPWKTELKNRRSVIGEAGGATPSVPGAAALRPPPAAPTDMPPPPTMPPWKLELLRKKASAAAAVGGTGQRPGECGDDA